MTPPAIVIPSAVSLPPVEDVVLENGLPVHLIRTAGQDVVRVSLVYGAGSAVQSKPFVASSTLNLLAEGSDRFTALEIAEKLDFVGSYFDVSIDRDYAVATFCCLEKFLAPTLEMLSEIVLRPAFPQDEVSLYARKRMERLAVERSKPATKARELFSQALFGDSHPYGISSPESDYLKLQRADVQDFYRHFYGADNCFAVCSLGTSAEQKAAIMEVLGQIPHDQLSTLNSQFSTLNSPFSTPKTDPHRYLPIDGAVQSAIRIGRVLFPRSHPDFVGMQVVATILGGYFGSRLTQNLREQRGYTYGVMAAMVNLRHAGYLAIATEVAAEVTQDAIVQIFNEMDRLKTELVSADELDTVRRSMLGEVMRILDGPFGIVDAVIENIQIEETRSDLPSDGDQLPGNTSSPTKRDYVNDFIREIESITPARIRELALKYLTRPDFTTVVVGKKE